MIGGSSRIPIVKQIIGNMFAPLEPNYELSEDTCVAEGAALLAYEQFKNRPTKKVDIIGKCYGVYTTDGVTVILPHDSRLPAKYEKSFTNSVVADEVTVEIYQGGKPKDGKVSIDDVVS